MIWVSPTEPSKLRHVADRVSMYPEDFGVDVLVAGKGDMIGIQRKTIPDFLSSLEDGRLTEQIVKMQRLDHALILIEGHVDWVNEMLLTGGWGKSISKDAWRRMMFTLRAAGVGIEYSRDLVDTIQWVCVADAWCSVERHTTLEVKGKKVSGKWGERTRDHYRIALLASLPGVGEELAKRIVAEIGWPLELVGELEKVRGLGEKKINRIKEILDD